jgi:hypothetical protein
MRLTREQRPWRIILGATTAAVVLATGFTVWTATGSQERGTDGTTITNKARGTVELLRQTELTRRLAEVDANIPVVSALLADDFTLVPPDGSLLTRADYLAALESGALDFFAFDPVSVITVRRYGHAAVLTYRSDIHLSAPGIGELHHQAWHTVLYEKRSGNWQVRWEQTTGVGFRPPA